MTEPSRKLGLADVDAFLEQLRIEKPPRDSAVAGYEEAAAVLSGISDLASLVSTTGERGAAPELLKESLVDVAAQRVRGGSLTLRYDVRRDALKRLQAAGALERALLANESEHQGAVQVWFDSYVLGKAKPLTNQPPAELEAALQAVLWLEELKLPGVPSPEEVRLAATRARFREQFERLAGMQFRGRKTELDQLRRFVGVIPPETTTQQLAAGATRALRLTPVPALSIFGPGGMGKSALMMRFFLEHLDAAGDARLAFAYLDFDNPFLNINDLTSLTAEIFRQLKVQYPELGPPPAYTSSPDSMAQALSQQLSQLSLPTLPFLVVLDTFEEVQYRAETHAIPLWDFLEGLQVRWPSVRVVISGRAPVKTLTLTGKPPVELPLEGLDEGAALAMLRAAGVDNDEVARALLGQVGRVPLSLRLAASVAKKERIGPKGLGGINTVRFFMSVSDELIQGQLFERVLDHIHEPNVRKVAHPGLVLRVLTPEVILSILKEPCELTIQTLAEAKAVYDELAREVSLVSDDAADGLRHRADLRRAMLKLLVEKEPLRTRLIHERAVDFYARPESANAAEELYHRLMLGQLPGERERDLRQPEVRQSLSRSLSELPLRVQLFLSGLGYDVDQEVLQRASNLEREAFSASKLEALLPFGPSAFEQADALLHGLRYRGANSPLYLQEARLRFLEQRLPETLELLDEGAQHAQAAADQARLLDLLCLKAWVAEEHTSFVSVLPELLPLLLRLAKQLDRPLAVLQGLVQQYRLGLHPDWRSEPHLHELAGLLRQLDGPSFAQVAMLLYGILPAVSAYDAIALDHVGTLMAESLREASVVVERIDTGSTRADVLDELLRRWSNRIPFLLDAASSGARILA